MGVARVLTVRGGTLFAVLVAVLLILVISPGATGVSDRLLNAQIGETLREQRQSLAQTIRDPDQWEKVLQEKKQELIQFYSLDRPWYVRLPDAIKRVFILDLGSARTLRTIGGGSSASDLMLERLPNTILLVATALAKNVILTAVWSYIHVRKISFSVRFFL